MPKKTKLYTSKAWCYKRYVVEKKTETEMAVEAETNQSTIHRWLVRHEII